MTNVIIRFPIEMVNETPKKCKKSELISFPLEGYYENKGYEFNQKLDQLVYAYETYRVHREYTSNLEEKLNFLILFDDVDVYVDVVEENSTDSVRFSGLQLENIIFSLMSELQELEEDITIGFDSGANILINESIYSFYISLVYEIDEYICKSKSGQLL